MGREINGFASISNSPDVVRFASSSSFQQTNRNEQAIKEALEYLASIDVCDLIKEVKIEHCRATRDLSSCGRDVLYVLNSCGHASLCKECSDRFESCPICRSPIPKAGDRFRLCLYYKCVEAGLIPPNHAKKFQDMDHDENQSMADVQRLYQLFDVAMENNLISLICHYITDVCMDETAVSSDPVTAFLLDEVVVKDWVKRTFKNILTEVQGIYNLTIQEMEPKLSLLFKYSLQLGGISNVLEVLETSFKGTISAQFQDLHQLQESVLKTKQHMEIMIWCIRHNFLDNLRSRYTSFASWQSSVRDRKTAAIRRAWPDDQNQSAECSGQGGSLFIEDAIANLEIKHGFTEGSGEQPEVTFLQKDGSSAYIGSRIEGMTVYPFENLRAAVDILFLHGSSDLVVAKQAILLYYLFDRHWTMPEKKWRYLIDDFSGAIGTTRNSILESFTFYLLDDHTNEALQEACHLLPEICGPATHPKIARVLLERQVPETALMVLRWSGRDGGSQLVSLTEAVTAVRVRVECGLLSEAFTYQKMICMTVKEKRLKYGLRGDASDSYKKDDGVNWMETLVSEFCCLCIRRNLVDRIVELPWSSEEEKHLHKCLLDSASDDPSSTSGSLLVVYYLQRFRYVEAYHVNLKLQKLENNFLSENSVGEEATTRMRSKSRLREELVNKSIELLPSVQQQQLRSGQLSENPVSSNTAAEIPARSYVPEVLSNSTSILLPGASVPPAPEQLNLGTPMRFGRSVNSTNFSSSSIFPDRLFSNTERGQNSELDISNPGLTRPSPGNRATLFKEISKSSTSAFATSRPLQGASIDKTSIEAEEYGFDHNNSSPYPRRVTNSNSSPYLRRVTANPVTAPSSSNGGLFNGSTPNSLFNVPGERVQPDRNSVFRDLISSSDPMDISSYQDKSYAVDDGYAIPKGGQRWRSVESSDEDEEQSPVRASAGKSIHTTSTIGSRRRRFFRK